MPTSPDSPWSATSSDIHDAIAEIVSTNREAALATVVSVEGSGYRRPGAKMVVEPKGSVAGAVTAGCLEESVVELSATVLDQGEPHIQTYDLTSSDDPDAWGLGLGCNGVVELLVEPIDESYQPVVDELQSGRSMTVITTLESSVSSTVAGDRAVMGENESVIPRDRGLPSHIVDAVKSSGEDFSAPETRTVQISIDGDPVRILIDRFEPAPRLLLFGGQPDAGPVVNLANSAGFDVHLHTARGGNADPGRFPSASEVTATRPSDVGDHVTRPDHTYAIVMSHNFVDDRLALESLLETEVDYIGVMGPEKRFRQLTDELPIDVDSNRIAAPVGLDLGGDEPIAIAFSIVGELLAAHNGGSGRPLSKQDGPIHPR